MKVDDLRERCRELGLTVSGKKQDLIDRLLDSGNTGESEEQTVIDAQEATPEADVSDAVDKLLARFEGGVEPEPEQDAIEAEVMEAEVVAEDEEEEAVEELKALKEKNEDE